MGEAAGGNPKKKKNRTEENSAKRRKKECGCGQEEMSESESYHTCADTLRVGGDGGKLLSFQFFCLFLGWGRHLNEKVFDSSRVH